MQRRRLQRILLMPDVANPPVVVPEGCKRGPKQQIRGDYQPSAKDYGASSLKVMADLMHHSKSDAVRLAAAKYLADRAGVKVKSGTGEGGPEPLREIFVSYVVPEDLPPLAEGDYDTSVVDEVPESDEPDVIVKDCE